MEQALAEARDKPGEVELLFSDEASFYRQPSQAWLWGWMGRSQPRLHYSHRGNHLMRVVGFLNARNGRVQTWDYGKVTAPRLKQTWLGAAQGYPEAKKIYMVIDNWPVHFHPRAQEALIKDPRLQVIALPTYAPWLNPIERLWRLVKQRVTHAHPWSDDFLQFKEQVRTQFASFDEGSETLLRYVGLFN